MCITHNGPEFVAHAVRDRCKFNSAGSLSLIRVSVAERLNRIIRTAACAGELRNLWHFDSPLQAPAVTEDWRRQQRRSGRSAHGDRTPAEFALIVSSSKVVKKRRLVQESAPHTLLISPIDVVGIPPIAGCGSS